MSSQSGPPYLPTTAGLGGRPTPSVDDPISGVLLVFFATGAALNMTIFQLNRRRSHKFLLSGLLFGFCMARILANVLRIAWASRLHNSRLAIAAQVLVNAGVVILFIVNIIFTQRILRAFHPNIGWSRPATLVFRFLLFSIIANLIMVIVAVVYSFYTLDIEIRLQLRKIQLTASTYLAILSFLPIPVVVLCLSLPRKVPLDKFGHGSMRAKIRLLLFTASLLSLGAGFRAGAAYEIRPISQPALFHHKACFYIFNYVIELVVVFTYALSRFDRRFHIPDGSSGPGDYSRSHGDLARSDDHVFNVNIESGDSGNLELSKPESNFNGKSQSQEDMI